MSTRSLTHIVEDGEILTTIYRHMDGYPEGHGADLAAFLNTGRLTQGLSMAAGEPVEFNGAGCLAAALVAHLKDGPGNIYIYKAGESDCGEESVYTITCHRNNEIRLKAEERIWKGVDVPAEWKVLFDDVPDKWTIGA